MIRPSAPFRALFTLGHTQPVSRKCYQSPQVVQTAYYRSQRNFSWFPWADKNEKEEKSEHNRIESLMNYLESNNQVSKRQLYTEVVDVNLLFTTSAPRFAALI